MVFYWTPLTSPNATIHWDAVDAWYPVHWPVFLFGVTPKGIEFELMLHCFIALLGTYLLVREYFPRHEVAALAALVYAF